MTETGRDHASNIEHPASHRGRVPLWSLMFSLIAPPLVWGAQLVTNYMLVTEACYGGDRPVTATLARDAGTWPLVLGISLATLAVMLAAAWIAHRNWRLTAAEDRGGHRRLLEVGEGRTRFLALWGLLMSLGFFAVTIFNSIVIFFVPLCGA